VCPPTVRLGRRHRLPLTGPAEAWIYVLDLLAADDVTLLDRHGRWYIAGRDPRWLRRNALVVLGNGADGADERVVATLARYRHHEDPILAEHARWASERLGIGVLERAGVLAAPQARTQHSGDGQHSDGVLER
jgi:epoxyqueuosine reductase